MAITSGFFNSKDGDRRYNAAQIGRYLQHIVSDGVFAHNSSSLQVLAGDGMQVEVQPGRAMMDYHYMDNDAPITMTLAAGGSQDRVDAIIMYVDMTERACGITIKEGTPAASPVHPALTRTDVRKEYMLAAVRVPRLSSGITQANITDTRADKSVCGWVTGLIEQVDTSTLFLQWQAAYEEEYVKTQDYLAAQQAAWQAFFDAVTHDNVLPAPALTQVGHVVTVNDDGTGYVLKPGVATDKTLTGPGAAADAAAVGLALTVPNLLDNSDFTDPVNNTGFTGGAPAVDNAFFIDRWKAIQSATKNIRIDFTASGIIVHVSTALAGIRQNLRRPKTGVTFAAKVNGKIESVYSPYGVDESIKTEGDVLLYVEWLDDALQVIIRNTGDALPNEYTVEWAALYEGEYTAENLPVYRPRGYSLEAAICGGGLNFSVVGGTTRPTTPTDNTIWVNTSEAITSWAFSATQPGSPTQGMVWITSGTESDHDFNVLQNNAVYVYPAGCKQYKAGAWQSAEAHIYQGGAWVQFSSEWNGELYDAGNEFTAQTGGWEGLAVKYSSTSNAAKPTITKNAGSITFTGSGNNYTGSIAALVNAFDLTDYTRLVFNGQASTGDKERVALAIWTSIGTIQTDNRVAVVALPTSAGEASIDVSALKGNHRIGIMLYRSSSAVSATMTRLRLE